VGIWGSRNVFPAETLAVCFLPLSLFLDLFPQAMQEAIVAADLAPSVGEKRGREAAAAEGGRPKRRKPAAPVEVGFSLSRLSLETLFWCLDPSPISFAPRRPRTLWWCPSWSWRGQHCPTLSWYSTAR
jgi:hypothetical protein